MVEEEVVGDEDDVDVDGDVDGVYDYVLMSLPCFRVISVTRTILGRNHFHCHADTHTLPASKSCLASS